MYSYIKGLIVDVQKDHIVVENHGIGYMIYVSNPYSFSKGSETVVYLYQQVKEDGILLFGFPTREEKELFLKLIMVKGIGCKSACTMLASGDVTSICQAIESGNVAYLKKIPGIGPKAAGQIILDLQGKVTSTKEIVVNEQLDEASEVLIALGYKTAEVDKVIAQLAGEKMDTNGYVKKALSMLVK
ncbi:MAG: Holliday junction branch migration protein RuvA [Faecalibacillus sp.]